MGSSKKHKKHKDRKHSSSNLHDESNHSFNSISNNSVISGEQGTLKLVLRVPGASTNSPHMSPSIIQNQDFNQDPLMPNSDVNLSMHQIEGRPYSSSSSKKMKKKKSKKKHKKHHSHHHSHHHHSHHHRHRSSCSHHSSKSSSIAIADTNNSTMPTLLPNQLKALPSISSQIQSPYLINNSLEFKQEFNPEFNQEQNNLIDHQQSLISTQLSPQSAINKQLPNLSAIQSIPSNLSSISNLPLPQTNLSPLGQQQLIGNLTPINVTPITSPTSCAVMNNEPFNNQFNANLMSNVSNNYSNINNNFPNSCSMASNINNNMINTMSPSTMAPSNLNFVPNMPEQQMNLDINNINNQQQIVSTCQQQTIISPITQQSISTQQSLSQQQSMPTIQQPTQQISPPQIQSPHHQQTNQSTNPQLVRTPIGVKPVAKTQFQSLLGYLLKQLEKRDSQEFFFWPVTDLIAPGYSKIITKPMDFSKIKQKISLNSYENLIQFRSDVKLMCDNAMTYNRPDTIYYKAARKLWHYAREKIFSRDSVLELVKLYQGVTNYELGLTCADYTDSEQIDVENYDYSHITDQMTAEQQAQFIKDQKQQKKEDEMTADEILDEARKTAQEAADRLSLEKPNGSHYTLLRQLNDGTTTLAIVGSNVNGYQEEKYVNLESLIGKLNEGAPHLPGFKESDLNTVKSIEQLPTSPFSSYLPCLDSSKSNLNEKESALLLSSYGDEIGLNYSQSLLKFASDSDYVLTMVDSLLDALTNGQHTKAMDELKENINISQNNESKDVEMEDLENQKIETEIDKEASLDQKLSETSLLVSNLESLQNQRLSSSTLPVKPNKDELKIAHLLTNKLTELIKHNTTPADVTDIKAIRKALGVQMKSDSI